MNTKLGQIGLLIVSVLIALLVFFFGSFLYLGDSSGFGVHNNTDSTNTVVPGEFVVQINSPNGMLIGGSVKVFPTVDTMAIDVKLPSIRKEELVPKELYSLELRSGLCSVPGKIINAPFYSLYADYVNTGVPGSLTSLHIGKFVKLLPMSVFVLKDPGITVGCAELTLEKMTQY